MCTPVRKPRTAGSDLDDKIVMDIFDSHVTVDSCKPREQSRRSQKQYDFAGSRQRGSPGKEKRQENVDEIFSMEADDDYAII